MSPPFWSLSHHDAPPECLECLFAEAVDVQTLEAALSTCFQEGQATAEIPARGSLILAVDGKTLRGTIPAGQTRGVHLVAAYLLETGVVLAQLAVDTKENEMVVVPTVVAQLDLTGRVVVGDAMQTQRQLSTQVVESGGDDLWFVKDNQPTFYADIERLFTPLPALPGTSEEPTDFTTAQQIDAAHGCLEDRRITVSSWLQDYSTWPYLAQAVPFIPLRRNGLAHPFGCKRGQTIEDQAHRFQHTFEPIEGTDRRQDMRGIRPLRAARFDEAAGVAGQQERIKQALTGGPWVSRRWRKSCSRVKSKPGSVRSRLSAYFQSIQRRTASAAWRSVKPSI